MASLKRLAFRRATLAAVMGISVAACAPAPSGGGGGDAVSLDEAENAVFLLDATTTLTGEREGSPEARAVLRLANRLGPSELGQGGVGLGPLAVGALTALRIGPDERPGTADDLVLKRLETLDAVPYVGSRSYALLLAQAQSSGLVDTMDPCGRGAAGPTGLPLPTEITEEVPDLVRRSASDRLEIWAAASSPGPNALVDLLREHGCAALTFDLDELGLDPDEPELRAPLRIVLLEDDDYDSISDAAGTDGIAYSASSTEGDAFMVPFSAADDVPEMDDTLAHELIHLLHGRVAPFADDVPWFIIEGSAIDAGTHFGRRRHGFPTGFVEEWLRGATGTDAATTFARYGVEDRTQTLDQVGHDQSLSGFFVEYLRTKHPQPQGAGIVDIQQRMTTAMRDASNSSRTFPGAFSAAVPDVTLDAAKAAYIRYLDDSAGDWTARVEGTVFAR